LSFQTVRNAWWQGSHLLSFPFWLLFSSSPCTSLKGPILQLGLLKLFCEMDSSLNSQPQSSPPREPASSEGLFRYPRGLPLKAGGTLVVFYFSIAIPPAMRLMRHLQSPLFFSQIETHRTTFPSLCDSLFLFCLPSSR